MNALYLRFNNKISYNDYIIICLFKILHADVRTFATPVNPAIIWVRFNRHITIIIILFT